MYKIIFLLTLVFPVCSINAQLLTKNFQKTTDSTLALYYCRYDTVKDGFIEKIYFMNGSPFSISDLKEIEPKLRSGKFTEYYENGNIKEVCTYVNEKKDGKYIKYYRNGIPETEIDYSEGVYDGYIKSYYENGNRRRIDLYSSGKFVEGKCYGHAGQDTTYFIFEKMARFRKGDLTKFQKYVMQELRYPPEAIEKGITGKVLIEFAVNSKGKVVDIEILQSPNYYLSKAGYDVILNSPEWEPAIYEGKNVKQKFVIPIIFYFN